MFREEHALKRYQTAHPKNKNIDDIKDTIEDLGLDASLVEDRLRSRNRSKSLIAIKNKSAN